ncbi:integron integrase [Adhaeretor mobilis]|uniref:Tyrosine recombinase XerC n=1 Tax=Adhaeretor mobilis TaxID=1930276 RepID=A0A517N092_9BACT|nr:Tyrosine recombinase XerC [Adhaeretor mobilis]
MKLLNQVRQKLRAGHYAYRTEQAYVHWIERFIRWHAKIHKRWRHPSEMGTPEVEAFLSHLAVDRHVTSSTQNQALSALLFLYRHVIEKELGDLNAVRAARSRHLPTVLTPEEVGRLLECLQDRSEAHGAYALMASLMYGSGLRLMECCRLRIKDIDFGRNQVMVRQGKGNRDRAVPLPRTVRERVQQQVQWREKLHRRDLEGGEGRADLPHAFERKSPSAAYDLAWQFVFASDRLSRCPRTGRSGRHHLHENALQKSFQRAVRSAGIPKRATCHTLRHSFATHLLASVS